MLVLTRKVDETIIIGDEQKIVAKILRVRGRRVRIGIEAPKHIKIQREELCNKSIPVQEESIDDELQIAHE